MRTFALITIWTAFLLTGCSSGPHDITILYTSDIHGRFLAEPKVMDEDTVMIGGFAALSGYMNDIKKGNRNTLYLDAGDLMTGNPICDIEYNGVDGGALIHFMEMLQCEAFALGNHEFDKGSEAAFAFAQASCFPMLCANLVEQGGRSPVFTPYTIIKKNGLRIGVIGLILEDFHKIVSKSGAEAFDVLDPAKTAQRYIDQLDPETDLIILLTHQGLDNDRKLAWEIRNADIIIGGHSHERVDEPELINGIYVTQAGPYCKRMGVLRATVESDTISSLSGELIPLVLSETEPAAKVKAFSDSVQAVIDSMYGAVIATTRVPLTREYSTSGNLGNLICDLLRERYKTDVAFANSGGIRKDLQPGPIRKLDIVEMLPFTNSVVLFEASGEELMKTARQQARVQGEESGEILQMSGMTIKYRNDNGIITVDEVKIGGNLLVQDRLYTVVAHDYITSSQPDQYLKFLPENAYSTGELFSSVVIEEIENSSQPLSADARPRLERIR
ncbi:bifunctional metallophosphatase/5'-nucleotidase [bacterium]|nr:bifunctional metallophosphatase/5'-nucleotidase [bacterium]